MEEVRQRGGITSAWEEFFEKFQNVNRELWLLLSLFVIAALINFLLDRNGMVLGLYTLPTIFSAYFFGRRHAVLTALASVLMAVIILFLNPALMPVATHDGGGYLYRWLEVIVWGGLLNITAYAMGTLYEKKENHVRELRQTYFGILVILQQFISNDKYTHNHSYRVALYAAAIAARMDFEPAQIDDIRAAALLHDLGKLETSREILHKAAALNGNEMEQMRAHVKKGGALLEPMGGSLKRILPIVLAHHEKFDGTGYESLQGPDIPIEARVLAVADAYDTLTSDRPYRRAITPFEAKEIIVKGAGASFDPTVVSAFSMAFGAHEMDLPETLVLM